MKNLNPDKELQPFGCPPSNRIFFNRNPKQLKVTPWEKDQPEGIDLIYIDDMPLFQSSGMVFWYHLGDKTFDIRTVRNLGGFPKEEYRGDWKWTNTYRIYTFIASHFLRIEQKGILDKVLEQSLRSTAQIIG